MRRFVVVLYATLAFSSIASAHEFYATRVPRTAMALSSSGMARPCITCHDNADGGAGCEPMGGTRPCLNGFGAAFRLNSFRWDGTLAGLDSDGDTFTNGQELQDPVGSWRPGFEPPGNAAYVTRPGDASSNPGQTDMDGDGYCWFGRDLNGNGRCTDPGENNGAFDCNDSDPQTHSGAMEICTNEVDNDCNGLTTRFDPACAEIVDRDRDGFCPVGPDLNRDGFCTTAAERTGPGDCDDDNPTVYPGARENCTDGLDNDCNGLIDLADPMCRADVDNDADGYCPIGRDLNGDGDCTDDGEDLAGFDCDDTNPAVNSGAVEICDDGLDNDCNGLVDFRDPACAGYFDADGDGYCPLGVDLDRDGNCTGPGEANVEPFDCDDTDPTVSPRAPEVCTNDRDDNCNGLVSLADPECVIYLDLDGDRYCFVGFDMNRNGHCADPGEEGGSIDCDDTDPAVNPTATEICTDGIDNDCNGSIDAYDPVCFEDYVDHDRDGWCTVGPDLDRNGDCSGPDEQGEIGDWAPRDPTIYPQAPENCFDLKDNDQDGLIDEGRVDPGTYCTRDVDHDGDGWCPIGRDVNGDGDCLDDELGENLARSDCDERDPARNPDSIESTIPTCTNWIDDDCDGDVDLFDRDCWIFLDRDGDGFCPMGIDDNGDGDCLDEAEDRFGMDCDDTNPNVNPRAREVCDNGIDDNCNGLVDGDDPSCPCPADHCDDGDPCTVDVCNDDRSCSHSPMAGCGDGGVGDGGVGGDPDEGGCGCATPGAGGTSGGALAFLGVAAALLRRRLRRR
ncbi:MAG: putative metal-binding motif-containing protein [Myxococcales bacterium]|nr:putative metal-binding motif-containing protein [Myxococcales bacterium]